MLILAGSTISNHTISPSIHHARPCFHHADANEGHAAWGRDSSWKSNCLLIRGISRSLAFLEVGLGLPTRELIRHDAGKKHNELAGTNKGRFREALGERQAVGKVPHGARSFRARLLRVL